MSYKPGLPAYARRKIFQVCTITGLCLSHWLIMAPLAADDIYRWQDDNGEWHYGDADSKPDHAKKIQQTPSTIIELAPLPPADAVSAEAPSPATSTSTGMTAASWAEQNCSLRTRLFYTDGSFIPCVPTDEVQVYLCQREPPRNYRNFFGRQYHYENTSSECGPEIHESEILFLRK